MVCSGVNTLYKNLIVMFVNHYAVKYFGVSFAEDPRGGEWIAAAPAAPCEDNMNMYENYGVECLYNVTAS